MGATPNEALHVGQRLAYAKFHFQQLATGICCPTVQAVAQSFIQRVNVFLWTGFTQFLESRILEDEIMRPANIVMLLQKLLIKYSKELRKVKASSVKIVELWRDIQGAFQRIQNDAADALTVTIEGSSVFTFVDCARQVRVSLLYHCFTYFACSLVGVTMFL